MSQLLPGGQRSRGDTAGVEFRPAAEADLAGECAVFSAAEGGLYQRHGFPPPAPSAEAFAKPHRHLLKHDGERSFVAEVEDRIVGFSAAFARGDTWFLSALFIDPEFQSLGIGRRLLDRSWGGDYGRRITITDSIQPVSNGLYAQRGLVPATPVLILAGEPRTGEPSDLEPSRPEPEAIAALDRVAYGFERRPDHDYWSVGAECTLWLRSGEPVAYSYLSPDGDIGPIAGRDPESAAGALEAELERCNGKHAEVAVPGSARELVEVALGAGLRFQSPPGFLLLSRSVEPPRSLAISNYWLL
jgi:GNAT superfamily N-acetyltransferase